VPPYLIYEVPVTERAGAEIIRFGDQRDLRGEEVVEAAGRRWQLLGQHKAADGIEWRGHFDAEPLD
jgi:hypothetical protein